MGVDDEPGPVTPPYEPPHQASNQPIYQPPPQGAGPFAGVSPEMVTWAVGAVSSGMLGNAAYDWLKKRFVRLLGKRRYRESGPVGYAEALAVLAVQARCGELGRPVPKAKALRCTGSSVAETGVAVVRVEAPDLSATVTIPANPWMKAPEVVLHVARPWG